MKVSRLIGPETLGWDRLFTNITCRIEAQGDADRFALRFPNAETNFTYVATVFQVPGA